MLELQFNRYRASLVEYSFPSRSRTKREKKLKFLFSHFFVVSQHSSHPLPGWAIFQNVYIGGTYVKSEFWARTGTLGGGDFFQVGLENSLYKT